MWKKTWSYVAGHWAKSRRDWLYRFKSAKVHIIRLRFRLFRFFRQYSVWLFDGAATLFALAVGASILSITALRCVANSFLPLETVLTAIGATYGTILVLVLTVSLIPIQRAGEAWSASIVRLYREDRFTRFTFVFLSILCVASFVFAIRGIAGIPVSIVITAALLLLGTSLDVLRKYHTHVCRLLDPAYGVSLAIKRAKAVIDHTDELVGRLARNHYQTLSAEQQENLAVEDLEAAIYPRIPSYPVSINSRIADLTEIAIKAISRGEKLLARIALSGIVELTVHYLDGRKRNLTLQPAPEAMFLAVTSDVNVITERVYENLREICHAAITQNDESSAVRVAEAHRSIAVHVTNLQARAFGRHSSPLAFSAIYSLMQCVKQAKSKNLNELPYQSASLLAEIAIATPSSVVQTDVHIPVFDGICEIATYFYAKRAFGLAEEVNGRHFEILSHMLGQDDDNFDEALRYVLEQLEILAPLALANEAVAGRFSIAHPLGKAYGLTNENSIGYLFGKAADGLPKIDEERDWLNPYMKVASILEIISDHLRTLGERNEFDGSFMLWDINQLIKHIALVIANRTANPLRPGRNDEQELIDEFRALLAFYWVSHRGKRNIHPRFADECCDSLAYIGITFFERSELEVVETCASNIRWILESYCETAETVDPYLIGDILAHLWELRLLFVRRDNPRLVEFVDSLLHARPDSISEANWTSYQHAILLRRTQLEERLERRDRGFIRDSAEDLLRRILR